METQSFIKSKASKIILGMSVVFGAIILAKSGYILGQWLHAVLN